MEFRRDVSTVSIRFWSYYSVTKTNLHMVKNILCISRSPVENVKVQIVTNTNRTLESFYIHKKPPREILTKLEANNIRKLLSIHATQLVENTTTQMAQTITFFIDIVLLDSNQMKNKLSRFTV